MRSFSRLQFAALFFTIMIFSCTNKPILTYTKKIELLTDNLKAENNRFSVDVSNIHSKNSRIVYFDEADSKIFVWDTDSFKLQKVIRLKDSVLNQYGRPLLGCVTDSFIYFVSYASGVISKVDDDGKIHNQYIINKADNISKNERFFRLNSVALPFFRGNALLSVDALGNQTNLKYKFENDHVVHLKFSDNDTCIIVDRSGWFPNSYDYTKIAFASNRSVCIKDNTLFYYVYPPESNIYECDSFLNPKKLIVCGSNYESKNLVF